MRSCRVALMWTRRSSRTGGPSRRGDETDCSWLHPALHGGAGGPPRRGVMGAHCSRCPHRQGIGDRRLLPALHRGAKRSPRRGDEADRSWCPRRQGDDQRLHPTLHRGGERPPHRGVGAHRSRRRRRQGGDTPLWISTERGYTAIVSKLLQHGADKSISGFDNRTPLEAAQLLV